jgi:lantibiotic transport system permease protein
MVTLTYYKNTFSSETLKIKNTLVIWVAIGAPLFILALNFFIFFFKGEKLVQPGMNPWPVYLSNVMPIWCAFFMPLYITIQAALFHSIEHNSNTWKQVFTMPVPKWIQNTGKYGFFLGLFFLSMVLMFIYVVVNGMILGVVRPDLGFQDYEIAGIVAMIILKSSVAALGIVSIQYFLSLRWKSFAVSTGIGLALTVTTLMLTRWEKIVYFPFSYPFFSVITTDYKTVDLFTSQVGYSLIVFAVVSALGLVGMGRRNVL